MDINEILDKYYNEVKSLTENIRKYQCPNCGGEGSVNKECKYCHSENKELIDNITRIEEILRNITVEMENNNISMYEIPINKLCNALCTISNHEENYIDAFLKKCNYKNKFYSFLEKKINDMAHDDYQIYPLTKDALESIVYMHPNDAKMEYIHKLIIRRILLQKPPISYECFIELITNFIKDLMHREHQIGIVKLVQNKSFEEIDTGLEGRILGSAQGCLIKINISGIEELYKYGKEDVLETIYHEVCHYYQNKVLGRAHGKIQLFILKDKILSNYIEGYYEQNYWKISFECQARYVGKKRLVNYINSYNMRFNNDSIFEEMKEEQEKMHMTSRIIDGCEVDINEYFDEFIASKPELLSKYPILNELYEIKDGMVIPVDTRAITR